MKGLSERLLEHASEAKVFAGDVERLEAELAAKRDEATSLNDRLTVATQRIEKLEWDLVQAELDEEIYDLIGDVQRGIRTLDELFERTVGS